MGDLRAFLRIVLGTLLLLGAREASGQQLHDDFNRANNPDVGGAWVEGGGERGEIDANRLRFITGGVQDREWVTEEMSGFYDPVFSANSCELVWAFNMRQSQGDPSGFDLNNYGAAFILGSTSNDLLSGQGYAVVYGQSLVVDPLRIVRFANGFVNNASLTNVVVANVAPFNDLGTHYIAVRVTYTPATNTWRLYGQEIALATFGTFDPSTASTLLGSAANATYTGIPLPYMGSLWNHATAAAAGALFDNVYRPSPCGPVASFTTTTTTVVEDAGTVPVQITIDPPTTAAGTITIGVSNGPGVSYGAGGDYTTDPVVVGSTITINVPAGATSASFDVNVVDDTETEPNETITFTLQSATGGTLLGSPFTHTFTIVDNDVTPTVNFITGHTAVLEGQGPVTYQLGIFPAAAAAGSVTIQLIDGPGAVYGAGNDYFTAPAAAGGFLTIPVADGATLISFTVTVVDDAIPEDTEQVDFVVSSTTGGVVIGSNNSSRLYIGDNDTPPTVLEPGDMVILGVNANNGACGGSAGDDLVSFMCFKPIVPGTEMILTDNGYSRCTPGLWGNSEGTVRMTRTGIAIPAGQVITFRITNVSGPSNVTGVAPDAGWTCTNINLPAGATFGTQVALNSGGDQIFFMQGGTWGSGTAPSNVFTHNATYDGNILYGFSTNPTFPWSASCTTNPNQRSDLPPGIDCFSMAPTAASDFAKYSGPITPATQRDWIIRADSPSNWTTYTNCTDYNGTGYNWLASPTLPIIAGAYVPGLWRGVVNTDWFECKNWDDVRVPTAVTDVLIDNISSQNCVVGVSGATTAECASLTVRTNTATRSLTINNGSTLAVGGQIDIERLAPAGFSSVVVLNGSNLQAQGLRMVGSGPLAVNARMVHQDPVATLLVEGDVEIAPGGGLDMQAGGVGGTLELGGDFINLDSPTSFFHNNSTVVFASNGPQAIRTSGFQELFHNILVDKPGGDLTLEAPVAVVGQLNLASGRVFTDLVNLLTIRNTGAVVGGSDLSFVHGPLEKIGITDFTYPVGKGGNLRPARITGIAGSAAHAFRVEYFPDNPRVVFNNDLAPGLDHISACEYWMIDRSVGTLTGFVWLSWDTPESCGVDELPDLRVARWDGTLWLDRGNGATTGDATSGQVRTTAVQTVFSPWTLASVTSFNPLPIQLLRFDAMPRGNVVDLFWSTATEQDNDHFTVERSADAEQFEAILQQPGAGNSLMMLEYRDVDTAPLPGLSYYRLRQTDYDGTNTVGPVVAVLRPMVGMDLAILGHDGAHLHVQHDLAPGGELEVLDLAGRLLMRQRVSDAQRSMLHMSGLAHGVYLLRAVDGERSRTLRFVF